MRHVVIIALALVAVGLSWPAWSQRSAPAQAGTAASVPWGSLDAGTREMLQPLHYKWERMSPRHQQHMLRKARHWQRLSPQKRVEIRERIERWQKMTPAERERARANRRVYRHLSPEARDKLDAAYERFKQMPEAQRDRLRKQWRSLSAEQRRHWIENGSKGDLPQPASSSR
jgi:hypothetical protein